MVSTQLIGKINEALCSFLASRKPEKFSPLHRILGDLLNGSVIDEKVVTASRDSVELIFIFSITGFLRTFDLKMGHTVPRFIHYL